MQRRLKPLIQLSSKLAYVVLLLGVDMKYPLQPLNVAWSQWTTQAPADWDEKRLKGFQEDRREKNAWEQERRQSLRQHLKQQARWEYERLAGLQSDLQEKKKEQKLASDRGPLYRQWLKEKEAEIRDYEKAREQYLASQARSQRRLNTKRPVSELEELGLIPSISEAQRVAWDKRRWSEADLKKSPDSRRNRLSSPTGSSSGGAPPSYADPGNNSSSGSFGNDDFPPPPPDFFDTAEDLPPPPPPPGFDSDTPVDSGFIPPPPPPSFE
jgi:hypothetical protein